MIPMMDWFNKSASGIRLEGDKRYPTQLLDGSIYANNENVSYKCENHILKKIGSSKEENKILFQLQLIFLVFQDDRHLQK